MAKFSVGVKRSFIAQHFLTSPDPGPEGELHSHHYGLEVVFSGESLDENGYLLDIALVKRELDRVVESLRDRTLNELAPFRGLNPSIEHLARIVAERLLETKLASRGIALEVIIHEDDDAWTSYSLAPR